MPQWVSETYRLPSKSELSSIEAGLNPFETYRFQFDNDPTDFLWFFSAASLAIRFLETLHENQQKHLRKIILDEDDKAIYNPETHARGLVKFCQDNLKLQIERRVGLWHHVFPSRWGADLHTSWWRDSAFAFELFLVPIVDWIMEASKLPALGMPSGSYTLTFKDCHDKHVWRIMREVVAFQEAYLSFQQRAEIVVPVVPIEGDQRFEHFPFPCHLPDTLPQIIKDILCGRSNMRLEHPLLWQWDGMKKLQASESWSQEDWVDEWELLLEHYLKAPPGGIYAHCAGYPEHSRSLLHEWDKDEDEDEDDSDQTDDSENEGFYQDDGSIVV
jgi:hypothetical protein